MTKITVAVIAFCFFLFFFFIGFNNIIDFSINQEFIQNTMGMNWIDDQALKWRAITHTGTQNVLYLLIIIWELCIATFCLISFLKVIFQSIANKTDPENCKLLKIALLMSFVLYMVGFCSISCEWFYLWQACPELQTKTIGYSILSLVALITVSIPRSSSTLSTRVENN